MPRLLTSTCPHRLRPSPTGVFNCCFSREGPLISLPKFVSSRSLRSCLTGAPSWSISREETLSCLFLSARLLHLKPSPTSAPGRCISLEEVSAKPLLIRKHMEPPIISYWLNQLVHLPGGTPTTCPHIGTPSPPRAVSYWRTKFMILSGGAPAKLPTSVRLRRLR